MRLHSGLDQGKKNYKKAIESLYDDVSKGMSEHTKFLEDLHPRKLDPSEIIYAPRKY